jgi:hypothetical protein
VAEVFFRAANHVAFPFYGNAPSLFVFFCHAFKTI